MKEVLTQGKEFDITDFIRIHEILWPQANDPKEIQELSEGIKEARLSKNIPNQGDSLGVVLDALTCHIEGLSQRTVVVHPFPNTFYPDCDRTNNPQGDNFSLDEYFKPVKWKKTLLTADNLSSVSFEHQEDLFSHQEFIGEKAEDMPPVVSDIDGRILDGSHRMTLLKEGKIDSIYILSPLPLEEESTSVDEVVTEARAELTNHLSS